MSRDYTHLYREELRIEADWDAEWDVFVSAFNESERVRRVFEKVRAKKKYWIVHDEYGFDCDEVPGEGGFICDASSEEGMLKFWECCLGAAVVNVKRTRVCLDATGFMRPQLMFLVNLLFVKEIRKFDVLYSEPQYYLNKDSTTFAGSYVDSVRQVVGFEGISNDAGLRDLLLIGAGYETHLISEVAEDKEESRKVVLLGLPSLRPDMYQQNAWRAWQASDAISPEESERYFAPAADVFATATVVSELVSREQRKGSVRHIYMAPLSTKAQAIGFALCYLSEFRGSNVSIIYPFTRTYEKETSVGLARIWRHTIEF